MRIAWLGSSGILSLVWDVTMAPFGPIALAAADLSVRVAPNASDAVLQTPPPLGCYVYGYRFAPTTAEMEDVGDVAQCQRACQDAAGCNVFGYLPSSRRCYFGAKLARIQPTSDPRALFGPRRCEEEEGGAPAPRACTERLTPDFPDGPSGPVFAPAKLQCWPRTSDHKLSSCPEEPPRPSNDASVGNCERLQQVKLPKGGNCAASCSADLFCPVWRTSVLDNSSTKRGSESEVCMQGLGYGCAGHAERRSTPGMAAGGQRLVRGHYRVLKDLTGTQVTRLQNVFTTSSTTAPSAMIGACRTVCVSLLSCEVWQYSNDTGCWVEDTQIESIEYPPSASSFLRHTAAARTVVAGEYIQRICGDVLRHDTKPGAPVDDRAVGSAPLRGALDVKRATADRVMSTSVERTAPADRVASTFADGLGRSTSEGVASVARLRDVLRSPWLLAGEVALFLSLAGLFVGLMRARARGDGTTRGLELRHPAWDGSGDGYGGDGDQAPTSSSRSRSVRVPSSKPRSGGYNVCASTEDDDDDDDESKDLENEADAETVCSPRSRGHISPRDYSRNCDGNERYARSMPSRGLMPPPMLPVPLLPPLSPSQLHVEPPPLQPFGCSASVEPARMQGFGCSMSVDPQRMHGIL